MFPILEMSGSKAAGDAHGGPAWRLRWKSRVRPRRRPFPEAPISREDIKGAVALRCMPGIEVIGQARLPRKGGPGAVSDLPG